MHGIAARRLFRGCPAVRHPHNRRSGPCAFPPCSGKRSTSVVFVQIGAARCMESPLVDCFGKVGLDRAHVTAGQGHAPYRLARGNGRRAPFSRKSRVRDAWDRLSSTVSGTSCGAESAFSQVGGSRANAAVGVAVTGPLSRLGAPLR